MINTIILALLSQNYNKDKIKNLIKGIMMFIPPEETDVNWVQLYMRAMKPII